AERLADLELDGGRHAVGGPACQVVLERLRMAARYFRVSRQSTARLVPPAPMQLAGVDVQLNRPLRPRVAPRPRSVRLHRAQGKIQTVAVVGGARRKLPVGSLSWTVKYFAPDPVARIGIVR